MTTGKWKDGRIGVYYGVVKAAKGKQPPMLQVWGTEGTTESAGPDAYDGLMRAIAEFFHTGRRAGRSGGDRRDLRVHDGRPIEQGAGRGAEVPLAELRK